MSAATSYPLRQRRPDLRPGPAEARGIPTHAALGDVSASRSRPAGKNFLQQQSKFDDFMQEYNHQRPHQAIGMRYPAELYSTSLRLCRGLTEPESPFHDRTVTVTHCGGIC